MKFPGDSEYQDVSFILGLHETGGNRVELVLQKRDPNVNSDLAWRDATTLDSQISTETATLRAAGREPRRLMLREFERYYTDRTVSEKVGAVTRQRRVIEERLVYAAVFDL